MKTGDPGDSLYFIRHGAMRVEVEGNTVGLLGPGAVLGEMSLLKNVNRTATVIAEVLSEVYVLPNSCIKEIAENHPQIEDNLWCYAGKRFARDMLSGQEQYSAMSRYKMRSWLESAQLTFFHEMNTVQVTDVAILLDGAIRVSSDYTNWGETITTPIIIPRGSYAEIQPEAKLLFLGEMDLQHDLKLEFLRGGDHQHDTHDRKRVD